MLGISSWSESRVASNFFSSMMKNSFLSSLLSGSKGGGRRGCSVDFEEVELTVGCLVLTAFGHLAFPLAQPFRRDLACSL